MIVGAHKRVTVQPYEGNTVTYEDVTSIDFSEVRNGYLKIIDKTGFTLLNLRRIEAVKGEVE